MKKGARSVFNTILESVNNFLLLAKNIKIDGV